MSQQHYYLSAALVTILTRLWHMRNGLFMAWLIVCGVGMSTAVKADYTWEYGGGPRHYFPSYAAACEYERAKSIVDPKKQTVV